MLENENENIEEKMTETINGTETEPAPEAESTSDSVAENTPASEAENTTVTEAEAAASDSQVQFTQPAAPAPQLQYTQPAAPAPQLQYIQPGAPAPQVQYIQPGTPAPQVQYIQPGAPAPQAQYTQPGAPAPQAQYTQPGAPAAPQVQYTQPGTATAPQAQYTQYYYNPQAPYSQYASGNDYSRYQQGSSANGVLNNYTNYNSDNSTYGYTSTAQTTAQTPEKPKKEKGRAARFFGRLGLAAAFGVVAAGMFIATLFVYNTINPKEEEEDKQAVSLITSDDTEHDNEKLNLDNTTTSNERIAATTVVDSAKSTATDVSEIVDKCMPSIVSINCTFDYESFWGVYETEGAGSGIIIEKRDKELIIATNNHVVEKAKTISVCFSDGSKSPATIKGTDNVADLAVISVMLDDMTPETLSAINVAQLGSSDEIKVGQMAIAIGNALGYGQSVTVGYISAKDREVTVESQKMVLLQTDAAINPGNSGGALINLQGEVIGINSVKYADSSVEGMGFAIPISRAQDILAELATREVLSEEEKGYLGVSITEVNSRIAEAYNWPEGIYIAKITEGGAAESSDLQMGDIITAVNGTEVKTSAQFIDRISSMRQGTEVTLTVQRLTSGSFEELEIKVTLGKNPEAKDKTEDAEKSEAATEGPEDGAEH